MSADFARPGPPHTRASRCSVACSVPQETCGRISCRHAAPDSGHGTVVFVSRPVPLWLRVWRVVRTLHPNPLTGLALAMLNGHDGNSRAYPLGLQVGAFDFLDHPQGRTTLARCSSDAGHHATLRLPATHLTEELSDGPHRGGAAGNRPCPPIFLKGTVTAIATAARKYSIRFRQLAKGMSPVAANSIAEPQSDLSCT